MKSRTPGRLFHKDRIYDEPLPVIARSERPELVGGDDHEHRLVLALEPGTRAAASVAANSSAAEAIAMGLRQIKGRAPGQLMWRTLQRIREAACRSATAQSMNER